MMFKKAKLDKIKRDLYYLNKDINLLYRITNNNNLKDIHNKLSIISKELGEFEL